MLTSAFLLHLALYSEAAKAATLGFTGSFDTSTWVYQLQRDSNTPTYPTPGDCTSSFDPEVGCLDLYNSDQGNVHIFSAENTTGTGIEATSWYWQNTTNQNYYVSFDYYLDGLNPSSTTASITAGSLPAVQIDVGDSSSTNGYLLVAPNQYISFSISVPGGSDPADLQISNFNYAVPGPLPATGAATAFGFSRRMRRRIKGELPPGYRKRSASTHPSSYLNLSPSSLHGLPATFSYTAMPHRPTLAYSFPTLHGLPATPPAPALEPAASDITAIQA